MGATSFETLSRADKADHMTGKSDIILGKLNWFP